MTEIVLDNFNVNYDGEYNYVEGTIVSATDDSVEIGSFVMTAVHGDAYHKVDEILQRSWINWHKPGYIPCAAKVNRCA